jgi:DNA processing protein
VYAELVEETGSALHVLESELERDERSGTLFDLELADDADNAGLDLIGALNAAGAELAAWRGDGIDVVSVLDLGYPENLRGVHDRPPLLFVTGDLIPADARAIAVVGSRAPTTGGIARARQMAGDLADAGYTVFSGLAVGIDTAAHNATLAAGGRTVAVAGTGLRHTYPSENIDLAQRIARECAVVSQFWPDSPPTRRSFPMRNAVMSGMTLGTVIVEASHTSGTRVQARLALAQGRPVFIHRSLLSQPWARELASRPGAYRITDAEEVLSVVERLTADEELVADERAAGARGR